MDKEILQQVRQNLGLSLNDTSEDARIARMGRHEILNRVLTWNNLIDYGATIRGIVERVYDVELKDRQ